MHYAASFTTSFASVTTARKYTSRTVEGYTNELAQSWRGQLCARPVLAAGQLQRTLDADVSVTVAATVALALAVLSTAAAPQS